MLKTTWCSCRRPDVSYQQPIQLLLTACNSSSRGSNALFLTFQELPQSGMHVLMRVHVCTHTRAHTHTDTHTTILKNPHNLTILFFSFQKNYFIFIFIEMFILLSWLFIYHIHALSAETKRGHCMPWNWNYRQLWASMRMLGIEPRFSGRAASALTAKPLSQSLK